MLALELSSHLLEIPNDTYMLLCQFLIGCSLLRLGNCKLIGLNIENNEKATCHIDVPF